MSAAETQVQFWNGTPSEVSSEVVPLTYRSQHSWYCLPGAMAGMVPVIVTEPSELTVLGT